MCSCSVLVNALTFFCYSPRLRMRSKISFQGEPSIASTIVPVVCTRTGRKHVASHCKEFVSRCAVRVYLYAHPCDPPIPHHPFYTRMSSSRVSHFFSINLYSLSSSVLFHRPKSIREERLRAVFEKHGEVTQVSEGHPCHAFTYSAGYGVD